MAEKTQRFEQEGKTVLYPLNGPAAAVTFDRIRIS